ncbi:unnamed protein product [Toxocara canis]|uniref:Uncharacterized protein n=1 Tax=Toxocara canis TaxID=6265 RepID=A0A183U8B8_TOXCA|nr:unnamed protein product [Toxocara canis]
MCRVTLKTVHVDRKIFERSNAPQMTTHHWTAITTNGYRIRGKINAN